MGYNRGLQTETPDKRKWYRMAATPQFEPDFDGDVMQAAPHYYGGGRQRTGPQTGVFGSS